MIRIAEIFIFAITAFALFSFIALSVYLKLKQNKLTSTIAQLIIDKQAILEELDRASFISRNSIDIENGFIKFLSESRESAFEYIENVQAAISNLKDAMDSGNEIQITESYNKLISFLPSDSSDMVE